jgi:hypothetical protein
MHCDSVQSLQKLAPPKPVIESTIFNAHFEKLFSKKSDSELGLTDAKVGPKVAPKAELSGAPSLAEVKCVKTKLGHGTAHGSNGLRPKLFKTGGDLLTERITHTYSKLGRMLMLSPYTNKRVIPRTQETIEVFSYWM